MLKLYLNFSYLQFIFILWLHILNVLFLIHRTLKSLGSEKLLISVTHNVPPYYITKKKKEKDLRGTFSTLSIEPTILVYILHCFLFKRVILMPSLDPYLLVVTALYAFALQSDFLKELSGFPLCAPFSH